MSLSISNQLGMQLVSEPLQHGGEVIVEITVHVTYSTFLNTAGTSLACRGRG